MSQLFIFSFILLLGNRKWQSDTLTFETNAAADQENLSRGSEPPSLKFNEQKNENKKKYRSVQFLGIKYFYFAENSMSKKMKTKRNTEVFSFWV